MLASNAIRETIYDVLASTLGSGVSRFEVEARPDHDGDPALFIKAFFLPHTQLPDARRQLEAMSMLRARLVEAGEDRLPYLNLDYPLEEVSPDSPRPLL